MSEEYEYCVVETIDDKYVRHWRPGKITARRLFNKLAKGFGEVAIVRYNREGECSIYSYWKHGRD